MILKEEQAEDAHTLGWYHGYNDEMPDNPFPANSKEFEEYEDGYEQGSRDC